jgi:hypothetical protein
MKRGRARARRGGAPGDAPPLSGGPAAGGIRVEGADTQAAFRGDLPRDELAPRQYHADPPGTVPPSAAAPHFKKDAR